MSQPPAGTRVLVVEDDTIIAMTVEDMLEEIGCKAVAVAMTVSEAMERIADTEFDIALLDLNLKDDTSLAVAGKLRELDKLFVFATGYDGLPNGSGFNDAPVISKPYRLEQLAGALAKVCAP